MDDPFYFLDNPYFGQQVFWAFMEFYAYLLIPICILLYMNYLFAKDIGLTNEDNLDAKNEEKKKLIKDREKETAGD